MLLLFVGAFAPFAAAQLQMAGNWQGVLSIGGAQLHLLLHVKTATDGSLTATLDSVDQGALGIPVSSVTMNGMNVSFEIAAVHGSYKGVVNAETREIDGTWLQGQPLPLCFRRIESQSQAKLVTTGQIDGIWIGTLDTGAIRLQIVFKITNNADEMTAQMQSPGQSQVWIPVTAIKRDGNKLHIAIDDIHATYEGKIATDLQSIEGTFTQGGSSLVLHLKRKNDAGELKLRRPQNPVRPYPYREEEVIYTNKAAGNTLSATLTIPQGQGPFPAVLLIAGSGFHDRDETLLGHKPFLVLSDFLTRRGIVVLRADKRGIGKSTGEYTTATMADFATDAEAGVAFLKMQPEVDTRQIGLIGHSEGAIIASMVAVDDHDVAFAVMMAGSGVPGVDILVEQSRLIALAEGASKEQAADNASKERSVLTLVVKSQDRSMLESQLHNILSSMGTSEAQIEPQVEMLNSPWMRYFLSYDPAAALRKLTKPVLVLSGSLDLQVSSVQNLPLIRKALGEAGNKHVEVEELPGLNHLFQNAKSGSPAEYAQIEETMSPSVMYRITRWVLAQ